MQAVAIIALLVLWGVGAMINSISESVSDARRKKESEEKELEKRKAKEEAVRFERYKKLHKDKFEQQLSEWQKIIDEELLKIREKREEELQLRIGEIDKENEKILQKSNYEKERAKAEWKASVTAARKKHSDKVAQIQELKRQYLSGDAKSVIKYCELVLLTQPLPDSITRNFELEYISESKLLICNYTLPTPNNLPTLREVKFLKTKGQLREFHHTQAVINKLYDDVIYQLTLAVIARLFHSDEAAAIESINFNGWVDSVDKGSGKEFTACIISLLVNKNDFEAINLHKVDPKECFKRLKGVGASQLYGITPIPPILKINTEDKRFIESYEVASELDSSINLAAMDWEDFEHLVREIFEKMFSRDGFEVKVTQSSRDKGVDAIAIDPDPIRGGRIVIQAKRYTNVVGVSAVRDLYGTVMNEGAMKGILVTTSNFGTDAYEFIRNKPLTLVSGGELLNMLSQIGHKARIDLKEAKRILALQKSAS